MCSENQCIEESTERREAKEIMKVFPTGKSEGFLYSDVVSSLSILPLCFRATIFVVFSFPSSQLVYNVQIFELCLRYAKIMSFV